MKAFERLIRYAMVHTASSNDLGRTPTTYRQFNLSRILAQEMRSMGMSDVYEDEHAYAYGFLPASPGMEDRPCIGLIAHIDTIPDFSGENVKPLLHPDYDGNDLVLGDSGRVLAVSQFPHLRELKGHTLITTDGTTVLGADDKAGVAEILTACECVIGGNIPHGRIAVCFTPDEEVGHGASLLDLDRFGADFAYTVDGGHLNEINYETFNASAAHWTVSGFNIHPGSARNTMINASTVAMEINAMLPAGDVPEKTDHYEGFFHLTGMQGNVEKASLDYIIRDHDAGAFRAREQMMRHIESLINEKYGEGTAQLVLREQYRNMAEVLSDKMEIVELADNAIRKAGLSPEHVPIRGGTDGSQLSYRGLPCPNLGTGGYAFHGPYEHITAENMDKAVEILLNILSLNTET